MGCQAHAFRFRIAEMKFINTRRGILSLVSSMYDPFGFVSPIVLPAKQVLQRLCQAKHEWDEISSNVGGFRAPFLRVREGE